MIAAQWILILALTNSCFAGSCPDTVAVSQIGPFETKDLCVAAAKVTKTQFTSQGNVATVYCVQTTLERRP